MKSQTQQLKNNGQHSLPRSSKKSNRGNSREHHYFKQNQVVFSQDTEYFLESEHYYFNHNSIGYV